MQTSMSFRYEPASEALPILLHGNQHTMAMPFVTRKRDKVNLSDDIQRYLTHKKTQPPRTLP
jgi:hypothetical protein